MCIRDRYDGATLGSMSFGQALSVSPIEIARAVGGIANGGVMMTPHSVSYTHLDVYKRQTSTRLGAASSLIMNALKHVSGVDLELEVISDEAIEPISKLKTHFLGRCV